MSNRIKPEQTKIRDRVLAVCSHGECEASRIWDLETCWEHLTDTERQGVRERLANVLRSGDDLRRLVLTGADLHGFDFTGADLSEAFFNGCNLSNCKFTDANLHRAFLAKANLKNCSLERANLHGTVFTAANLENVNLLAFSIKFGRVPINLTMNNFGKRGIRRRPHISELDPHTSEATYRALKTYFSNSGEYDSASWASYCERLMQRKNLWLKKDYFGWIASYIFGAISGYGEKPLRAFIASIAVVVLYALIYQIFGFVIQVGVGGVVTWWNVLAFSFATFCGISFPDLAPQANSLARVVVSTEAFWGIFALGLFIFTLTKRYVAR
jgi:hypothetical protein